MASASNVCVVTGGAQGIGRTIAERFLRGGWTVVTGDVDSAALEETGEAFADVGEFRGVECDVRHREAVERLGDEAESLGPLRCWVNNAAIAFSGAIHETDPAELERGVATNFLGVYLGCEVATRRMLGNGGGSIVNISSVQSMLGIRTFPGYAACKGAVNALTMQVAAEYAGKGIRVNAVAPGVIVTPMHEKLLAEHPDAESVHRFQKALTPIGRYGKPEDVAEAVWFLASEETAGFITGLLMKVDGGATVIAPGQE